MDPFDILPMLPWEKILSHLENPRDKLNTIKTNRSFERLELFQENEMEWKFCAVLGILFKHRYLKNTRIETSWLPEDELKSTVLNCRLVSKGTKWIVDNLVELYLENCCWIPPFTPPVCLANLEQVESCLARAEQLRRSNTRSISPFIGGGVFYLHCGDAQNNFERALPSLDNTAQLLSHPNIGVNLRGIRVQIYLSMEDLQGTCNFVRRLVQLVPNVTILSIIFKFVNDWEGEFQEEPVAVALAELRNLKHLELHDSVPRGRNCFLQNYFEFSRYFEQLTCLEMTFPFWKDHYNGQVTFPQLRALLFTDVPISGQNGMILDIIENLNAPALERFTLETMAFHLFLCRREDFFFTTFLRKEVYEAISEMGSGQSWTLDRTRKRLAVNSHIFVWQNVFKVSTQKESSTMQN